jgi:hypothetical protein
VKAFTDYPLFDHEKGKAATLRPVRVVSFDNNKYCVIEFDGVLYSLKCGYVYRNRRMVRFRWSTWERRVPVVEFPDDNVTYV